MHKFEELDKRKVSEVEKEINESWGGVNRILERQIEVHNDKDNFVFYDGPAFANGFPGLHHMVAKNLKDIVCKYNAMQGKKVIRKIGWDTHGLPIENHVEKKLGFTSKTEIENFGIQNFNDECRKSVRINEDAFVNLTNKMGQFIDTENPYLTMDNSYIETEWWILKNMFDKGYFYEGNRVMPYCPKCGTGLATHEVAQGYQDVSVDTVYVTFKKKDEDVYFLVWTTTPWTLISNVALCVNPELEYSLVESMGNKFIIATSLISTIFTEEVKTLKTYLGSELEGMEYEQLIPSLNVDKKAFVVTADNYVTASDGTGIVHIAPAFGEDDARIGEKYDLPFLNPVGKDGKYIEGLWNGTNVFDADLDIIKYLKAEGKLLKKQKITHNYPHCWRCSTPLLYYAMPAYYVAVSKMRDQLVEANSKVNWYPSYVGEKRFANWLSNTRDWNVSRTRYWGSPIPYYKCDCGHTHMVGSIQELKEMATKKLDDNIDLHKPFIDEVKIKCSKCNGEMTRIPDVLDCWFDSGSMPFAQYHYPFENKELFDSQFPADFICEGIDQTRGWFYTLMVISTFVKGCAPFKNVLVNDLLLDSDGKKMSKSRGNIVEPFTTIEEHGADAVRYYLPYVSPVWTPLKFDIQGIKEVHSKFLNPYKNTYTFFSMYANLDNINIEECNVKYSELETIDKWLLSKYNNLVKNVVNEFNEYDLNKVVRLITTFISDDLSNWYIRRNRERFWGSELTVSKKAVYKTTYDVLVGLTKLLAPVTPYITEEIYRKLTKEESVHLATYPVCNEDLIDNKIENKMDLVRDIISIGRMVREKTKIKVRQPLSECLLDGSNESVIKDLTDLIKEELNVKEIVFTKELNKYMNIAFKPNFKEVGKTLGNKVKSFAVALNNLTEEQIKLLENKEDINLILDNEEVTITSSMVEMVISTKEGFDVGMENNNFVILNTSLNEELINEGIVRELVSKIQNLRKTKGLEVSDHINIFYNGNEEFTNAINSFIEYIKSETLADNLTVKEDLTDSYDLNGHDVKLDLEKAK